jgi:hypothetical protein
MVPTGVLQNEDSLQKNIQPRAHAVKAAEPPAGVHMQASTKNCSMDNSRRQEQALKRGAQAS